MPRDYRYLAARLAPHILHDAREWLIDCFPDQDLEIMKATHGEVVHSVQRLWDGGLHAFIRSSILRDRDPFIREPITLETT